MKNDSTAENKFQKVMHEFGQGELKSHDNTVTNPKQAVVIAFSEARKIDPEYGMMQNGGGITDAKGAELAQIYATGTAKQLWEAWDTNNRIHFLIDHATEFFELMGDDFHKSAEAFSNLTYDTLPADIRKSVVIHHAQGMYANGGSIDETYIDFLNKKKGFQKDRKIFKGKNAYQKAEEWGRKNLENFHMDMIKFSSIGSMATGGEVHDRMYNFLEDDLKKIEKAISEGNNEEVERFFSYWNQHLKSLKTKTNDRMYNFFKDDLEKLEKAVNEGDKQEVERFFSYWGYHLKSLKMAQGGSMADGGETGKTQIRKQFESSKQAQRYLNGLYNKYNYARLIDFPRFAEKGTYVYEVSQEMADGGETNQEATVLVISSKDPLYTQLTKLGSPDAETLESLPSFNVLKGKDGKIFVAFPLNYIAQVDKNVIDDDLSYIKNNYKVSSFNWIRKPVYANGGGIESPLKKLTGQLDDIRIDLEDEDEQILANITSELEEAKSAEEVQKILSDNADYITQISDAKAIKEIRKSIAEYHQPPMAEISKLSPAKKKILDRINTLKSTKANAGEAAQKSIQKKIDVLQNQFDYNPSAREKAMANKGKFALDVPASYSKAMYKKLWAMKVFPQIHKLNGTHSIVVNSKANLGKAYEVYSDMLKAKKEKAPSLPSISRKL